MPRYIVERTVPGRLEIPTTDEGTKTRPVVVPVLDVYSHRDADS